jgi:hypothetical protein
MVTAKLSTLTDTERVVVDTITMRLNPKESLQYLKESGFDISERTYFRYKRKVETMKWDRLLYTANRFTDQHLQRIDKLELVEQLMWKNYHQEKSAYRRVGILQAIVSMQPYLSNYYGATTFVLARRLKTDVIGFSEEEQKSLRDMTPLSGVSQQE